ncbi:MAG TPA: TIGR01777 family oxidoreductase [Acidimicrobiales bacterium]|nr:TIGR01777 family oxidoreductase [Acidimicrobiales bacterium]
MNVLVSGSHGLIGSAVVASLVAEGHTVRRLARSRTGRGRGGGGAAGGGVDNHEVVWDPEAGTVDEVALAAADGVQGVVHLAGAGIGDKRWSDERKVLIRRSRVDATHALCTAFARMVTPPRVMVSGSAVGYYGDRGAEVLTEDSPGGSGFLAEVCRDWEAATAPAAEAGTRVVNIRSGIVMSAHGGALKKQLPLFRLGLGGKLGNGKQYTSWVSIDDEVGAILHALGSDSLSGPVNATAPEPVTAGELARVLGRVLRRPVLLPVPRVALSTVLGGELAGELLASQRALPARLLADGYTFRHRELEGALRAVLGR